MTGSMDQDHVVALVELLFRLRGLLARMPDSAYTARPVPSLSGSVGEHVRHCLDHISVFMNGATAARRISYDHRTRDTSDETKRNVAIARIDFLLDGLDTIYGVALERSLTVHSMLHQHAEPVTARSSVARELAFVVSHTIHHFAVIGLLLDRMGVQVPAQFAHAPSTLKAA